MKVSIHLRRCLAGLFLLVTLAGCQSFKEAGGLLEHHAAVAGMSSTELRAIVDDLVLQYASRVELAADEIIAQADDGEVHRNALLWKSNGISACFQAATRRDPLAAFLNIWILNKQSLELFQQTDSRALFGEEQSVAIDATLQLERSFDQVLGRIGKAFPIGEDFAIRFAADYPIHNLYFDRASIAEHYTDYIEKIAIHDRDLKEVVGNLDGQIDQFQKLSALYAEFLPKQARWQAELLALEMIEGDAMQVVLNDVTSATESMSQIANVVNSIPDLVGRERDILRQTIAEERVATMNSLEQIQSDTMTSLQQIQVETIQELQQERVAVMQEMKSERATILDALHQERIAATEDFTGFSQQVIDQIDSSADIKIDNITQRGVQVADHVFKRIVQLGIAALAILAFFLWLQQRSSPSRPLLTLHRNNSPAPRDADHRDSDFGDASRRRAA